MVERFSFSETALLGCSVVERKPIGDSRGFLARIYCNEVFNRMGMTKPIAQINHTLTEKKGTVRGMHYQDFPDTEAKLVSCIKGLVWDVAVDLRQESATFLQWHAEMLSAENGKALFIPEGFAHGFQTLGDDCELLYLHTASYAAHSEGAVNAQDPRLMIDWPLAIEEMSERDRNHPLLSSKFIGINRL